MTGRQLITGAVNLHCSEAFASPEELMRRAMEDGAQDNLSLIHIYNDPVVHCPKAFKVIHLRRDDF